MKLGRVKARPEAGFDLTPMIDVVLLLIIFFVLSAQFAQGVRKQVALPTEMGEKDPAQAGSSSVVIDIDRSGEMFRAGERLDMDRLKATLRGELAQTGGNPDAVAIIVRADRDAESAHLNKVARALSEIGLKNWKLATSADQAPPLPAGGGS
ncbi:MAG: biopolymer transporter ExbD [Planctomycetota bacterium]